ncbi:hypothetical protein AHAS_Ahas11G0099300 [Arachis hypogaea]
MAEMNQMKLRGKIVFVGAAKYRRMSRTMDVGNDRQGDHKQKPSSQEPLKGVGEDGSLSTAHGVPTKENVKNMLGNQEIKKMKVAVVAKNLEWVQRSLVGVTTKPIDFTSLRDMVTRNLPSVIRIREMGACKALLTFDIIRNADETYTFKLNFLLQVFHRVWRCKESERCESRRVWLECLGVPLCVWS